MINLVDSIIRRKLQYNDIKQEMLNDPTASDKLIGHIGRGLMTEEKAAKVPYGSTLDKVLSNIDTNDPRRSALLKLRQDVPEILRSVRFGQNPESALAAAYNDRIAAMKPETFKFIRSKDGEGVAPEEGYSEWERKFPGYSSAGSAFGFGAGSQVVSELLTSSGLKGLLTNFPRVAKVAGGLGKFLSMAPARTPLGAVGRVAGAALLGAAGLYAGEAGRNALVKNGAVELAEQGSGKRLLQDLTYEAPGMFAAGKISSKILDRVLKTGVSETVKKEGLDFVLGKGSDVMTPKNKFLNPTISNELTSKIDDLAASAKDPMAKFRVLNDADKEAIFRNADPDKVMNAAVKRNMEADIAKTAAEKKAIEDETIDLANTLKIRGGLEFDEAINKASSIINPSLEQRRVNANLLKEKFGFSEAEINNMTPREQSSYLSAWEQHASENLPALRDEILPPAVLHPNRVTLENPKVYRNEDGIVFYDHNERYQGKLLPEPTPGQKNTPTLAEEAFNKYFSGVLGRNKLPPFIDESNNIITRPGMSKIDTAEDLKSATNKIIPVASKPTFESGLKSLSEKATLAMQDVVGSAKTTREKFDNLGTINEMIQDEANKLAAQHKIGFNQREVLKASVSKLQRSVMEAIPAEELDKAEMAAAAEVTKMVNPLASTSDSVTGAKLTAKNKTNKISPADKNQANKELAEIVGHTGPITSEDMIAKGDEIIDHAAKWNTVIKYAKLGLVGSATVGLSTLLPDKDAQAGVITPTVIKDLSKATVNQVEKFIAAGFGPPKISEDGHVVEHIMRSMSFTPKTARVFKPTKPNAFDRFLSPGMRDDIHFNAVNEDGSRAPYGMGKEIGYRSQTMLANTDAGLKVVDRVLKDAGVETNIEEISAFMKPLVDKYHKKVNLEMPYWAGQLDVYDKVLAGKFRSVADSEMNALSAGLRQAKKTGTKLTDPNDIAYYELIKGKRQEALAKLEELKPIYDEFTAEHEKFAKAACEKWATSRVAFAVDGTGMKAENPWLVNMLTPQERQAAREIDALNKAYAVRMKEVGHDVVSSNYIHHPAHPEADFTSDLQHMSSFAGDGEEALRLAKFHRRMIGSRLMVPDTHYIMGKYLPDANKRIEISEMWKNWDPIKKQMQAIGGYDGALKLMNDLNKAFDPLDTSNTAKWLNRYSSFEVARLLAGSTSVPFKHALKLMGNWTIFPTDVSTKAVGENFGLWSRQMAQDMAGEAYKGKDQVADLSRALTAMHHTYAAVSDMAPYELPTNAFDKFLTQWNKVGSIPVNGVERFDRGQTFISAMMMAEKKGMTPEQAMYGLMDSVLRVNFLTGPNNPTWLKDPKIRTMMMFQGTPFKILEQRAMLSYQAGKDIKATGVELLKQLRADVKEGEARFKWNLLKDELTRSKDAFGEAYSNQFLRQMIGLGTVVLTGKYAFDSELMGHVVHLPGLKLNEKGMELGLNPAVGAAYQTITGGNKTPENEDDFWLSRFFQSWIGKTGVNAQFHKLARLNDNDIPKIYKDSKLNYLFGVPRLAEEE